MFIWLLIINKLSLETSPASDEHKFIKTGENHVNRYTFVYRRKTGRRVIKQLEVGFQMSQNDIYRYKTNAMNLGQL